MIQNIPGSPQQIEVWGVEFTEFRTVEQAIENLKTWINIGMPDRVQYRLWAYVPLIKSCFWGVWDSVECHMLELKVPVGGVDRRWEHLIPSRDLEGVEPAAAAQMLIDLIESTNWETGFFDWRGAHDA